MREKAVYRPFAGHATPRDVLAFITEVFASLDAYARPMTVEVDFSESGIGRAMELDLEKGEPVLRQAGAKAAHGRLRGRWLAEHDVPLTLSTKSNVFTFVPTVGNRIRVRSPRGALSWRGRFWYTIGEMVRGVR